MGKALVIKNVNFGANKLTTVQLENEVPCTGISLSESTLTLENVGTTETLTATVTPADTTDAIVWSTSDPNVVDVVSGVLTVVGVGTVTITATCGEQSASCDVTTKNQIVYDYKLGAYCGKAGTGDVQYATLAQASGGSPAYGGCYSPDERVDELYLYTVIDSVKRIPIKLSYGAKHLTFTVPSNCRATVFFTSTTTGGTQYSQYAGIMGGDASAYDSGVPLGNRIVDVPANADSFTFNCHYPNGTVTDQIMGTVTVVES